MPLTPHSHRPQAEILFNGQQQILPGVGIFMQNLSIQGNIQLPDTHRRNALCQGLQLMGSLNSSNAEPFQLALFDCSKQGLELNSWKFPFQNTTPKFKES